jgi:hypothetical protein
VCLYGVVLGLGLGLDGRLRRHAVLLHGQRVNHIGIGEWSSDAYGSFSADHQRHWPRRRDFPVPVREPDKVWQSEFDLGKPQVDLGPQCVLLHQPALHLAHQGYSTSLSIKYYFGENGYLCSDSLYPNQGFDFPVAIP